MCYLYNATNEIYTELQELDIHVQKERFYSLIYTTGGNYSMTEKFTIQCHLEKENVKIDVLRSKSMG